MKVSKRWIEVSFQKEGTHAYPAAATDPKLADVAFLAYPHRHIFHIKVMMEVFHNERDVEFILFKRDLQRMVNDGDFNNRSCETIAEELAEQIKEKYGKQYVGYTVFSKMHRDLVITVSEDGENGAILEFEKDAT
jgi:hypothetical protein